MTTSGLEIEVHGNIGALTLDLVLRTSTEPTLIVGPNGAGKTSVLMMVLGAVRPRRGRIVLHGEVLFDDERAIEVPVERRRIAYLPQRYALFPHLDVLENVAFGARDGTGTGRRRQALELLASLGLEGLARRRPSELSGGEAQRVALARALACAPGALLLDEPLAALDATVRREMRRFLVERVRALAMPTLIVTHDRADAEAFDSEVLILEHGSAVQRGHMADLAAAPATAFVREFIDGHRSGPPPTTSTG